MIELFANIPERVRKQAKFWVDQVLQEKDMFIAMQMLQDYRKSCLSDEEREFLDFYFNLRVEEQLAHENLVD